PVAPSMLTRCARTYALLAPMSAEQRRPPTHRADPGTEAVGVRWVGCSEAVDSMAAAQKVEAVWARDSPADLRIRGRRGGRGPRWLPGRRRDLCGNAVAPRRRGADRPLLS